MAKEAIDDKAFEELVASVGGDAEFVGELVDTYLADAPNLLAQMHDTLAAGDADSFRRAAHTLKSSSASIAALELSGMAKELEMMGRAGTLEGAAAGIAQVEAEYARVKAALERKRRAL